MVGLVMKQKVLVKLISSKDSGNLLLRHIVGLEHNKPLLLYVANTRHTKAFCT